MVEAATLSGLHMSCHSQVVLSVCLLCVISRAKHRQSVRLDYCVDLPLQEGVAFEFNNALLHAVRNQGPGHRIHLVIDVSNSHQLNVQTLQRGQVCQYVRGKVKCKLQH